MAELDGSSSTLAQQSGYDSKTFKRVLSRNILLPLGISVVLCSIFVALLLNLLSVNQDVLKSGAVIREVNDTLKSIVDSETGVRGFLVTGREIYLEPHHQALVSVPSKFASLKERLSSDHAQLARISTFERDFDQWVSFSDRVITLKRGGKYVYRDDSDLGKALMDRIRSDDAAILYAEEARRDTRSKLSEESTHTSLVLTVLFSIVAGIFIAWMGRKQLLLLSGSYERTLQRQSQQNDLLTQQAWLRTGQAELGNQIRGDLSAAELGQLALDHLASYLGATVGALYEVQSGGIIARVAGHAFSTGTQWDFPNRFRTGEGVVGKVAATQELVRLENLPDHYLQVQSGLGIAPAKTIMVAPISADGMIQGVLELGFLGDTNPRVSEFLVGISGQIGHAMKSAAYRARLQDLLNESQQLTEELQTQQEELRVSNEELAERSRALLESQARLEGQHAELEQTNEQLQEQTQRLELQRQDLDLRNQELEVVRSQVELKASELETASRYKSEFLANMSHELRTPLNSTLILAKLLRDNPDENLTPEQVEFASTIYAAGTDLLNLINDILDLSKVEAGKIDIHSEKIKIDSVLHSLERTFRPLADEKKLKLKIEKDPHCPAILESDHQRVEQILKNLLSNAVKFTEAGEVAMKISLNEQDQIIFEVQDSGVGIETTQQEVIFEAFRQADGTTNRKFGGTGLGLSISRNLAHLLGGTVTLKSEPGRGSCFTLTLPRVYEVPLESPVPKAPSPLAPPIRPLSPPAPRTRPPMIPDDRNQLKGDSKRIVLVVEDEMPFAKVLLDLAHELDFQCVIAGDTTEGYALALQHQPAAIVLDMKLPDGTGLSLLDRLKNNPQTRHIPVHAISAMDYSREALHLGAVGYSRKPLNRDELRMTFKRLEERFNQKIKRILLVEDDATQRMSIEKLIGGNGVEIISVGLGADALKRLHEGHFDCMIMDLALPDMSGFSLLEKISEEQLATTPIIVYTGRNLSASEEERLRRYSRTIIIKGARSPERLLDEVTLFIHQVEAHLTPERQKILRETRNREKAFEGRKILLVDDDVRNIFALTSALEHKGAEVKVARNGSESLDRLDQESDVDLVLMDIMMPGMDGYEAMRRIREQARFKDLPIIAVTAKAMKDDHNRCLSAGANDYLAKPVDVEKLVSLMRVWLPT